MSERLDSKGRRVGKRAFNGPGNVGLRRNEAGLAPGLEQTIEDAANYLEGLVASYHAGNKHRGRWATCPLMCHALRAPAEQLREGLRTWTGRDTKTRIGG